MAGRILGMIATLRRAVENDPTSMNISTDKEFAYNKGLILFILLGLTAFYILYNLYSRICRLNGRGAFISGKKLLS